MVAVPYLRQTFLSLFLILLLHFLRPSSALSDSDALIALKKSFTNTQMLDSWAPGSQPCTKKSSWVGVKCYEGIITGLHLSNMGLSGKIDIDVLLNLTGLRTLSFINNAFAGPIPEFNRIGALKALYLTGNQFSGEIPHDYFSKMGSLKKVWFARNQFTGPIPSSLSELPLLLELHLEQNSFSGSLPDMKHPKLESFNVSNNQLVGSIPESLSRFKANSFAGNAGLCGTQLGKPCQSNDGLFLNLAMSASGGNEQSGASSSAAVMILAVILGLGLLGVVAMRVMKKNQKENKFNKLRRDIGEDSVVAVSVGESKRKEESSVRKESVKSGSHHGGKKGSGMPDLVMVNSEKGVFGLSDLMKAAAEVLGTGGLGSAYKAVMGNGFAVVVKRMRHLNRVGNDAFEAEMQRLGTLRHRNILPPLAFHFRKEEKLLVYEFVPKGSLLYLLHGDRGPNHAELDWPTRLKIVRGIARGMAFVHVELRNSDLPHGNLKSSNILLAHDFEPLLADFGFFPLVGPPEASNTLFAYKSPESLQYRHVSPKSDVYCLGVVILEILTGKFPSQYLNHGKGGTDVVQWVATAISEHRESQVFDPEIAGSEAKHAGMERLLHVGSDCVVQDPGRRPDMPAVLQRIEEIATEEGCISDNRVGYVAPSLKDGYADASIRRSHVGQLSSRQSRRENSIGRGALQRNGESFTFDIS